MQHRSSSRALGARHSRLIAALAPGLGWLAPAAAQQCAHSEVQHMIPSDYLALGYGNDFGEELALDGDRLVVGATDDPNPARSGAVYVFERSGALDGWAEVAKLEPSDPASYTEFGKYLSLDGDRLVAGLPYDASQGFEDGGAVYVFERGAGGAWSEQAKLFASGNAKDLQFGRPVAVSGDTLAAGAPNDSTQALFAGAAYVFERGAGGTWNEAAIVYATDPEVRESFGLELDLEGDTLVVGALDTTPFEDAGAAFVYERDAGGAGNWGFVQKLQPANVGLDDYFGLAISLDGDLLAVGAWGDDGQSPNSGAIYVYQRPSGGGAWSKIAKVHYQTPMSSSGNYARRVELADPWLLSGAASDSSAAHLAGSAYLFRRDQGGPNQWGEVAKLFPSDGWPFDYFGSALALDGQTVMVGAHLHAHWYSSLGGVWVFDPTGPAPAPYCTAGTTASGCRATVAASGLASRSASSGFLVSVSNVEGQKDGTLYFGLNGAQANPWGTGTSFQCVVPPVVRTGVLQGSGAAGTCEGLLQLDFNAWMATHANKAPSGGTLVRMQSWFRDPLNTGNQSTSLSDAIEFTVCP